MRFGFGHMVAAAVGLAVLTGGVDLCLRAQTQSQRQAAAKAPTDPYGRPAPTAPGTPAIPSANRYRTDKVFLEQADSLYRHGTDTVERQIVSGDVRFRQGGMWMYCDSAYYYPERNSMDAFGHVEMRQGDTLSVYADKLFYDGTRRYAELFRGPSQPKVRLRDTRGELETDTLYYDVAAQLGSYGCGGRLTDDVNTLTSIYGEYSPETHDAFFRDDVELVNHRDGYRLLSDRLRYNTATNIARIETPSRIFGESDSIVTSSGWYNTANDSLELTSRSTVFHRDSLGRVTTLTGDSIVYDRQSRISRVYAFGDEARRGQMVITDTARKAILTGYYGYYNDSTREAYATIYPLLVDYSRDEPLFLRADTIFSRIINDVVVTPVFGTVTDSVAAAVSGGVADSTAAPDTVHVPAGIPPGGDSIPAVAALTDTVAVREVVVDSISTPREWHYAKAYPRARFFNADVQGVAADSMVYREIDSMVYMHGRPVIWSGERQVNGPLIMVHLNDSTADRADLPQGGMMAEHIEEDFYNLLTGKIMTAWLNDRTLDRLVAYNNVETIFLPEEEDSTFNRLVNASGDSLDLRMADGDIRHLRLWPQVEGSVTPLFMVRPEQKSLKGFRWLASIRPRRETDEEGTMRWGDDFGEISDELEEYFAAPDNTSGPVPLRPDMPVMPGFPARTVPDASVPEEGPGEPDAESGDETAVTEDPSGDITSAATSAGPEQEGD